MARTYLPTLRAILRTTNIYIARYQTTIEEGLTAPQLSAFLAFIQCLIDLISALGEEPIGD